jgi:hypothetical protein
MSMKRVVGGAIVAVVLVSAALSAQQAGRGQAPASPPQAPAPPARLSTDVHPDISGIWTRLDTSGAGSWAGLAATFPTAELRPEFAAKLPPGQFVGVGQVPQGFTPPAYDIRNQAPTTTRCAVGGGGFNAGNGGYNIDSLGMSLMVSNDEVLMLRDGAQGGRRIRLDGKGFPDPTRMNGLFSIGRWEGDALIVTTRGFGSGQVQNGRGWTEPSTELTETIRVQPGGDRMVITYTFSDPNVYVKPHSYEMVFERLPVNQYIFESWCDSREWIEEQRRLQAQGGGPATGRGAQPAAPPAPAGRQ